jgi:hypothetical protein
LEILMDYVFAAIFALCAVGFAVLAGLLLLVEAFGLSAICLLVCWLAFRLHRESLELAQQG